MLLIIVQILWIFCRLTEKCNSFQKAVAAEATNQVAKILF